MGHPEKQKRLVLPFKIGPSLQDWPFPSRSWAKRKKLNFYFHTSLWHLKRFYEGLKGLHKIF